MTKTRDLANLGSGFLQTGAAPDDRRPVDSKLKDVVSVKDFGAVGNGAADDTAAIQDAINAFPVTNGIGGAKLFFPRGTYLVDTLVWRQSISAFGEGHYTSIIKARIVSQTQLILFQDVARISICDLQFDADNKCLEVFRFSAPNTVGSMLFEHLDLHGATQNTIHLLDQNTAAPDDIAHIVFTNCYLRSDPSPALNSQYKHEAANGLHITFINGILSTRNNPSTYNALVKSGQTTFIDTFFAGSSSADIICQLEGQVKVIGGRSESTGYFLWSQNTETGGASLPHSIDGFNYGGANAIFLLAQGPRPIWVNNYFGPGNIYADTGSNVSVGIFQGGSLVEAGSPAGDISVFGQFSGTFLPTFMAVAGTPTITYSTQKGFYTKTGRLVHCIIELAVSSKSGNGSQELLIGNLPFTAGGQTVAGGVKVLYGNNFATAIPETGYIYSGNTKGPLVYQSTVTAYTEMQFSMLQASSYLILEVTYVAAS